MSNPELMHMIDGSLESGMTAPGVGKDVRLILAHVNHGLWLAEALCEVLPLFDDYRAADTRADVEVALVRLRQARDALDAAACRLPARNLMVK